MKTAYFDCYSGISGNMMLGALLDLGVDLALLKERLRSLDPGDFQITVTRVKKNDISAVYADVVTSDDPGSRTLADLEAIIDRSGLEADIKVAAKRIFHRLAEAEARVHGQEADQARLHEVGATDTIIDVVGSLIGLKALEVGDIVSSPLNLGSGTVVCSHGRLPVPAPITAELVKGFPVYSSEIAGELTTPTGAAIVTSLANRAGSMPLLRVNRVGYGAGKMDLAVPNALRVFLGETSEAFGGYRAESLVILETNMDDMNPQFYDHILDRLLEEGALDVFLTPIQMKKTRPGTLLSVLSTKENVDKLIGTLFSEGSTLGVRISEVSRLSLPRSSTSLKTRFGEIRIKLALRGDGMKTMSPEYDDCKKAARENGIPLVVIYEEVRKAWQEARSGSEDLHE